MKKLAMLLTAAVLTGIFFSGYARPDAKSIITVDSLDKTRRKNVYDGLEPDSKLKIKVPNARADYAFTFAEIVNTQFIKLQVKLGEAAFQKIVKTQGYRIPKTEFERYVGEDRLPLYYYTRPNPKPGAVTLILVSMGEYQPARYIAHVEGIWRITGAKFQ